MLALALGLGLLTALGNILGSYLATLGRQLSRQFMAGVLGLGGGFILGAALLEMLPEVLAGRQGLAMPMLVGVGYLGVFIVEQLLNVHLHRLPGEEGDSSELHDDLTSQHQMHPVSMIAPTAGLAALVAFNVHDFLDGVAIGASILTSTELGVLVFIAVVLHEIPAGVVVGELVLASGKGRKTALLAGASIGATTLLGIAIPFAIGEISSFLRDAILALATGTFLYVGATILIPLSEASRSRRVTLSVVFGFGLFALTTWLIGFVGEAYAG
jgi:zinc transporter ZupT